MRAHPQKRSVLVMAAAVLALAWASPSPATAAPVATPTPALSADLQEDLTETYGEDEGAYLQRETLRMVQAALARAGAQPVEAGGALTVEITIVRATPNRPTIHQLHDMPGLSMQSLSIGGAEFEAVIRDASGAERARVTHERFAFDVTDSIGAGVWSDARQAMRGFARKVAEAYVALG